ncbi:MAG: HlyD family efflux transporter periplasmic adaptor subunit [Armatimonadota bacterium]
MKIRTILIILAIVLFGTLMFLSLSGKPVLWQQNQQPNPTKPSHPTAELLKGLVQGPQRHELKAAASGTILAVGASETMPVAEGQLIAQIDSNAAREDVRAARARLQQVQAQTSTARTEGTGEKLRTAQANVQAAQASVKQAEKQLEEFSIRNTTAVAALERAGATEAILKQAVRARQQANDALQAAQMKMGESGQLDPRLKGLQQEVKRTTEALVEAQKAFTSARQTRERLGKQVAELVRLQRGIQMRKSSVARAEHRLQQLRQTPAAVAALRAEQLVKVAQTQVEKAEQSLAACAVRAENPGRLAELHVRPGMKVQAGQPVAVVEDTSGPRLVFEAPAAHLAALLVGQRAHVAVADPGESKVKDFAAAITGVVAAGERAVIYLQPLGKVSLPPVGTALTAQLQ